MVEKEPVITAWVTKWALTQGIFKVRATVCTNTVPDGSMISWNFTSSLPGWSEYAHREGKDWHRTVQGAVARAEVMRKGKIATLRKKIAELEKQGKLWPVSEVGPQ
jgi:hypothetical protein